MGKFLIKRWTAQVNGHADVIILASTRGKAFAECWRRYTSAYDCTFKRFIQIARVTRNHDIPPHFSASITVDGEPAFFIEHAGGNSLHFSRPGSDVVSLTHRLDAFLPWDTTETEYADIPE